MRDCSALSLNLLKSRISSLRQAHEYYAEIILALKKQLDLTVSSGVIETEQYRSLHNDLTNIKPSDARRNCGKSHTSDFLYAVVQLLEASVDSPWFVVKYVPAKDSLVVSDACTTVNVSCNTHSQVFIL